MTDSTPDGDGQTPDAARAGGGASNLSTPAQPASGQAALPPARGPSRGMTAALCNGVANLLGVAAIIYFTYYLTFFFARGPAAPELAGDSAEAKKNELLSAADQKLLTTYGVANPALKSVRIPVDRAMELIVAESAGPPAAAGVPNAPAAAPKVGQPATTPLAATPPASTAAQASAAPPAPAATPVGMPPAVLYGAVCVACHGPDGRGTLVRAAMPVIPDFTDAKWEHSRTDAELEHSILDGKGHLMLPMKDKLTLAQTDPKAMVAFVRHFQSGSPAAVAPASPPAPAAVANAAAPATSKPAAQAAPTTTIPAPATAVPAPVPALAATTAPAVAPTTPAVASASGPAPAASAKLRASAALFLTDCVACHGPDGRGTLVRAAMPPIPDFTTPAFQSSRSLAQLSVSILEGKGTLMPPWHGKVSPEQARDLAAYVRTFGPANPHADEAPTDDFGNRYQALKQKWDALELQARALSGP
ncbi:MAG: cytochrome c [Planctomycetota bacterium]|nr:cytochrome c [Planctomycetota bacterium]